ncbi:terpene synthase family protein [Burkholderia metallica]|uniref:terpene synthase family protein n=1 Tax=Burkholderia metallica TaxID=488729 RepID=UPI001CF3207C|nr:hypothetical protein [Burkholderia metallica]MCA8003435.1 hypothetical protein [Burkholderia metallica]
MTGYVGFETVAPVSLYCPFDVVYHTEHERVSQYCISWASNAGLIRGMRARSRFEASRIGEFVSLVYPRSNFQDTRLLCQFMIWLFMFDDQFDEGDLGRHPEKMRTLFGRILSAMEGGRAPESPIEYSLREFWASAGAIMPREWQDRFLRNFRDYLNAYTWEANNRVSGTIPGLKSYVDHRTLAGGIHMAFDLIEISRRIRISSEIFEDPKFRRIRYSAANVVCWHNDLFSFKKELASGDVHNLVVVIKNRDRCSLQQAWNRAANMVNEEVRKFVELEKLLPKFSDSIDFQVQAYIDDLRNWMRGHLSWTSSSGRFEIVEREVRTQMPIYLEDILTVPSPRGGVV